jgi:hypothetical protein
VQVGAEPKEWRVVVALENDAQEASYVYDLVHSGRLLTEKKDCLPLPFRGAFLFKLPKRPRPLELQVARFEAIRREAAGGGLKLLISCPRGPEELLVELESALRDVPPASEEEFKADSSERVDEFSRVHNMNFAQRVIYARRAGQSGRAALMQRPNALVLLYLCKNPLITLQEIIQIAKIASIDAMVAECIA